MLALEPGLLIMPFRFIHTADLHLDSPLQSLALRDPELAELVGTATRRAFETIIGLCLDERVDALMIAGDLYDSGQTSMKTALFLAAGLRRLSEAGIAVFIIRGNHDAASRITRELSLPDGITVFGGRAGVVTPERAAGQIPVAVHGISFARPAAPESLVPRFRPPVPDAWNTGLLHTSLGGAPGHDPYAPCSVAELVATGFDYWCLGHIHRREVHHRSPYVVMPGMPQGRDIGETGEKSVTLVHVDDHGDATVETRSTGFTRFERVAVALDRAATWQDFNRLVARALETVVDSSGSEQLIVRLELRGTPELAWNLRRDPDHALAQAQAQADALGRIRIEKLEFGLASTPAPAGPVTDLGRMMRTPIADVPALHARAHDLAEQISTALPREARDALGATGEARTAILERLAAEGSETVLAHLGAMPVDPEGDP